MTDDDIPTVPLDANVMELGKKNAPRTCYACGDDAEFYVYCTDERAETIIGAGVPADEWPVNAMLCRSCFSDADRVETVETLV